MKPPFQLSPKILNLISDISRLLGKIEGLTINIPEPKLRRENRIRTIKGTLAIEGHTFTIDQITGILENKKVLGTKKEISEVKNAIALYEDLDSFNPESLKAFLKAHAVLMTGLIESSGKFRSKNVGVLKGKIVKHVAPKPVMVPELMANLLNWSKKEKELPSLIKSCVVHYEIEFIHPFEDGNGRMGRFWQTAMLSRFNPIFKYVPVESLIEKNQQKYYEALEKSDKAGESTIFIEFMLSIILKALEEFDSETVSVIATGDTRMEKAQRTFGPKPFSRKEYMELFKTISSATASRDLRTGVEARLLKISGVKNQTRYTFIGP
jgi:Fic family protein